MKKIYTTFLLFILFNKLNGQELNKPFIEGYEPGTVLIALSDSKLYENDIIRIQLEIAEKAAQLSKVIILVNNMDSKQYVLDFCSTDYFKNDLCNKIENGEIKFEIIPHDSPWIRDYGPQFMHSSRSDLILLKSEYQDQRQDFENKIILSRINNSIVALSIKIKQKTEIIEGYLFEKKFSLYISKHVKANIKEDKLIETEMGELELLEKELLSYKAIVDAFALPINERANDDGIAYKVGDALYDVQHLKIIDTKSNIEGGNLLKSPNCDCFTTSKIINKNNYDKKNVDFVLQTKYGCKRVIYLEALPGDNIIEHVDMFLLPVSVNSVILASFDPNNALLFNEYNRENTNLNLSVDAEIISRKNKIILESYGYNVISIPSYLPSTISKTGYFSSLFIDSTESFNSYGNELKEKKTSNFYPSLTNCLVQVSERPLPIIQILMPFYEKFDITIFLNAKQIIEDSFEREYGKKYNIIVDYIESEKAAQLQGAIHCLTLTIPNQYLKYKDLFYDSNYSEIKEKIGKITFSNK